jgi:hypothetical protein
MSWRTGASSPPRGSFRLGQHRVEGGGGVALGSRGMADQDGWRLDLRSLLAAVETAPSVACGGHVRGRARQPVGRRGSQLPHLPLQRQRPEPARRVATARRFLTRPPWPDHREHPLRPPADAGGIRAGAAVLSRTRAGICPDAWPGGSAWDSGRHSVVGWSASGRSPRRYRAAHPRTGSRWWTRRRPRESCARSAARAGGFGPRRFPWVACKACSGGTAMRSPGTTGWI